MSRKTRSTTDTVDTRSQPQSIPNESLEQPNSTHSQSDPQLLTAFKYCAISALIGAFGGAAAKYNLQYSQIGETLQHKCIEIFSLPPGVSSPLTIAHSLQHTFPLLLPIITTLVGILVKVIQLAMTIGANTWGLTYALRASHIAPVSVTNTLCGGFAFVMNATLGVLFFQEELTQRFFIGLLFIFTGLFLICHDQIRQAQETQKSQTQPQSDPVPVHVPIPIDQSPPPVPPSVIPSPSDSDDHKGSVLGNFLWQIHLFFEPLEERPIETFFFGILVGVAALVIGMGIMIFVGKC